MENQNEHELGKIKKKPGGHEVRFERIEENYPFGGEERAAARKMKAIYREIVARQFPELVK